MLIRLIVFGLFILSGFGLSAQEVNIFPNAIWTYTPSSNIDPIETSNQIGEVAWVRDTTIDGQKAAILLPRITNREQGPDFEAIIWHDQQKMYFREDEQWKLFCDFGLGLGDTLVYQIPRNHNAFDIHCREILDTTYQAMAIVDSISEVLIGETFFKQLHFRSLFGTDLAVWELGLMTELLSSEYGYFGRSAMPCPLNYPGSLRCFQDKYCELGDGYTLGYQSSPLPCFFLRIADGCGPYDFGLAELLTLEDGIYVNPTNQNELPIKIHVYDLSGRTIFEGLLNEKGQTIIPTTAWTSNIYVVRLLGRSQFLSKKLWLNH